MTSTPPNPQRKPKVRTSTRSKPFVPPKAGPDYNERLSQVIQKCFRGDPRFQIAMFCKHLDWGVLVETSGSSERRMRFAMGAALQLCVTQLAGSRGIRLQNLSELSQKHVLMLIGDWRKKGDADGVILSRVALVRRCFCLLNKHAPLCRKVRWTKG
jgi:hypothetical protein